MSEAISNEEIKTMKGWGAIQPYGEPENREVAGYIYDIYICPGGSMEILRKLLCW